MCAFNLGAGPAVLDLGGGKGGQPLGGHGFSAHAEDGRIEFQSYGAWFGQLD